MFDITKLKDFFSPDKLFSTFMFLLLVVFLFFFFKLLHHFLMKFLNSKTKPQVRQNISKAIRYTGFVIIVLTVLNKLGVNLSALLGAAGIAGIAIGLAAQTSISSIISGIFLMTEHSFDLGDYISVAGIEGTIQSVDLLSVKIITTDNRLIRVPNDALIKANLENLTRYPIRRTTIKIRVSYDTNLNEVKNLLELIADKHPLALKNPKPYISLDNFEESSITFIYGVWVKKNYYIAFKTSLMMAVHETFKNAKITIAFPQMDIHTDFDFENVSTKKKQTTKEKKALKNTKSTLPDEKRKEELEEAVVFPFIPEVSQENQNETPKLNLTKSSFYKLFRGSKNKKTIVNKPEKKQAKSKTEKKK